MVSLGPRASAARAQLRGDLSLGFQVACRRGMEPLTISLLGASGAVSLLWHLLILGARNFCWRFYHAVSWSQTRSAESFWGEGEGSQFGGFLRRENMPWPGISGSARKGPLASGTYLPGKKGAQESAAAVDAKLRRVQTTRQHGVDVLAGKGASTALQSLPKGMFVRLGAASEGKFSNSRSWSGRPQAKQASVCLAKYCWQLSHLLKTPCRRRFVRDSPLAINGCSRRSFHGSG